MCLQIVEKLISEILSVLNVCDTCSGAHSSLIFESSVAMKVMETITASVSLRRRGDSGPAGARGWSGTLASEGLFFARADFIVDYRGENLTTPGDFVHRFSAYKNGRHKR